MIELKRSAAVALGLCLVALLVLAAGAAASGPSILTNGAKAHSVAQGARIDPAPLVTVNTMAFDHGGSQTGIRVGDAFYSSKPDAWAQLLVLDRSDLEPVSGKLADLANKSFLCKPQHACADAQKALTADLAKLDRSDLVIVSSPYASSGHGETPIGLEPALSRIGVGSTGYDAHRDLDSAGGISAIGIPGTPRDHGHWRAVSSPQPGAGRMRDFLVRNNENEYVFSPRERIEFDTQDSGSSQTKNVIRVGNEWFDADVSAATTHVSRGGGFQVVVIDRRTLRGSSRYFPGFIYPGKSDHFAGLADFLKKAADGDNLVFIASRGYTVADAGGDDAATNANLKLVADQIERLGGTRLGIFTVLDQKLNHENSYTLVGWSGAGAGHGVQTVGVDTPRDHEPALNTAPVQGTLAAAGPNSRFTLQSWRIAPSKKDDHDPSLGATELSQLALSAPSEGGWPEHGDQGHINAIRWIGEQVFGTDHPRAEYWTVPYVNGSFDYSYWTEKSADIGKLTYTGASPFSGSDLQWAQNELRTEIGWLISEHRYVERLSSPFATGQLQSWADFQQIANAVRDKVGVSPDAKTHATVRAVFNGVRGLLDVAPGPQAKAVEAANSIYETVAELIEINRGEPAGDEFQTRADELGAKLVERLNASRSMLDRELPNIVSEDYEKLKVVGQCTSTDPNVWSQCPYRHSGWEYTQDDQQYAASQMRNELKIAAYGSLLAARYTAYQLPPWWSTKVNDEFYGWQVTLGFRWYPFRGLPASAQMAKPIYLNAPSYGHKVTGGPHPFASPERWKNSGESWQISALGYRTGEGTILHPWVMHYPDKSVMEPLFKPTSQDGFGLDPESFFDLNFKPESLDHYPENGIDAGWCLDETGHCSG